MKLHTKLSADTLRKAEQAYNAEYIDYYGPDNNVVEHTTPEDICINNDNKNALSTEAKEVIDTVVNIPVELFGMITTKHGNISKMHVKNYFRAKFGKAKAKNVFAELATYVNAF